MVMAAMACVTLPRCLQILFQLGEELLGGGSVSGLERLAQGIQIVLHGSDRRLRTCRCGARCCRRSLNALHQRINRLGVLRFLLKMGLPDCLGILLQFTQGTLCRSEAPRLEGLAQGRPIRCHGIRRSRSGACLGCGGTRQSCLNLLKISIGLLCGIQIAGLQ